MHLRQHSFSKDANAETFGLTGERDKKLSIDTGEVRRLIAADVLNDSSATSVQFGERTHKKSQEQIALHDLPLNTSGLRYDSELGQLQSPLVLKEKETRKKDVVSELTQAQKDAQRQVVVQHLLEDQQKSEF